MVIVEERVDVLRSSGFDVHAFLRRKTAENHEYEQSVKKSERSVISYVCGSMLFRSRTGRSVGASLGHPKSTQSGFQSCRQK